MPIRPVSFLAQAAAQRQQTRENEKQREFQKEQALRDFGMNIGQSIVASLGNFGAQAGADAIRFNREEPYKMLESGVNPMPEVSADSAKPVGTGAADMLSKAAMARAPMQAPPTPAAEAPASSPKAPSYPMRQAAPVAKPAQPAGPPQAQAPAFDPYKAMRDPSSVLPRQATPSPSAPTPAPAPAAADAPGPQRPSAPPFMREEVVSQSVSTRGDAPEAQAVKLRALQEMEKITQRWLSGEPLRFVKKDGTPAEPREAAFAEAYQMKQDLNRLDMLSKAGLIEAEEAKAVAYQIKAQAEGQAATTKATSDQRLKMAQATEARAKAANAMAQVLNAKGGLTKDPLNELLVTERPGEWATSETVPNAPPPARGGGAGAGGGPVDAGQIGGMVQLTPFDVNKRDAGIRPPPTPIPMTPEGLKAAASAATKTIGGAVGRWGQTAEEAKEALDYAAQAEAQTDPAIKQQLVNKGFAVLKRAQARELGEYAGTAEVVSTSPADALKAAEDAEKAKRAEEAKTIAAKLAAENNARKARKAAIESADKARGVVQQKPDAADLFPSARNPKKLQAVADAILAGKPPPSVSGLTPDMLKAAQERAKPYLDSVGPFRNRYTKAKQEFIDAGGTEEEWNQSVPPPGPSEQSPGQFPPPGDESKVDELFQMIESQPWSAERKRRVFLTRAREAGLA